MQLVSVQAFAGPSLWAPCAAAMCQLEIAPAPPLSAAGRRFLAEELLAFLPLLALPGRAEEFAASLERRLAQPGPEALAELAGRAAIALQRQAGADVERCWVQPAADQPWRPVVTVACWDTESGHQALRLAVEGLGLLLAAARLDAPQRPAGWDPDERRQRYALAAWPGYKDINLPPFLREAAARDIPWRRIPGGPLVRLGQGRRQRFFLRTTLHNTTQIASLVARNKRQCHQLLAELGFPLPRQRWVASADAAAAAAAAIGYPVVVKPNGLGRGIAVSVGLGDEAAVRQAFELARRERSGVLVESLIPGDDHRILVVGGRMLAAARKRPGQVTGDGLTSVAALVARENRTPRREMGVQRLRFEITFDAEATRLLAEQGLTAASVPAAGQVVALRRTANASTGGLADDVTETIHPANRLVAERAAAAIDLEVCGVDFITPDITRPWFEVGGAICEMNDNPGIAPHLLADGGRRDVTGPMMDRLYPPGSAARIPIAALCGSGAAEAARLLSARLQMQGLRVGLALGGDAWLAGERIVAGARGQRAAEALLADPGAEAAVLELTPGGLRELGLPYDRCDAVALVGQPVQSQPPPEASLRLLLRHAVGLAVLEAAGPLTATLAGELPPARVCLAGGAAEQAALAAHRARGGLTVALDPARPDRALLEGGATTIPLSLDPATGLGGLIAATLAWALSLSEQA